MQEQQMLVKIHSHSRQVPSQYFIQHCILLSGKLALNQAQTDTDTTMEEEQDFKHQSSGHLSASIFV